MWRKDLYQKEAERQLSNEHFNTRLETDRTDEMNMFIKSEIDSNVKCKRPSRYGNCFPGGETQM